MALVKFAGSVIRADPVEQKPNGNWLMRSRQHSARTVPGTTFEVTKGEIIEMASAEMPGSAPLPQELTIGPVPDEKIDWAALNKAMAEERNTLPTPAELLAAHRKNIAEGKTPPGPFQVPRRNPGPQPTPGDTP